MFLVNFQNCQIVDPTLENGEDLCIRVCFNSFFSSVFHAKSGITSNHSTDLSDIILKLFHCDSNRIFSRFEKNRFQIFGFFV